MCTWTSHQFLQMIKQSESFLIGHRGEGFIRVHLMQIWDQVCEDIIRPKLLHLQNDTTVYYFTSKLQQEFAKKTLIVCLNNKIARSHKYSRHKIFIFFLTVIFCEDQITIQHLCWVSRSEHHVCGISICISREHVNICPFFCMCDSQTLEVLSILRCL